MVDTLLMTLGFIGTVDDDISIPTYFMFTYVIFNNMGKGSIEAVNKTVINLVYLVGGSFLASFMGLLLDENRERQASWMWVRYHTAVLQQDVEYFNLNADTSTEVITSITNDNLVIQDCLSEKVPNFIMNNASYIDCCTVGFFMMWRLALVALPTVALLVIFRIIYSCILMDLARKMQRM
ncbi:hypothetical protein ZIOFF_070385 [Zingiber officinale]|uniref:ABC transmembrane type-1 domain-containing protein n=1 Tax=Zingiber officinale TaxID=94328 RepID=A0A8J5CEJ7_ZINOF|nr:hypothetical protein ZIOFF_070385 [Zingiber officinale]